MANIIKIKRSTGNLAPSSLNQGELAYVQGTLNQLFIGSPADGAPLLIGGKYFTDLLNVTAGTATNGKALVLDSNGAISGITSLSSTTLNGGNLRLFGNTVSSTNTNGAINLTPNGTGTIQFYNGEYTFPTADGSNGEVLRTDGNGNLSWGVPASTLAIAGDGSTTGSVALVNETLSIFGSTGVSTAVNDADNSITITLDAELQSLANLATNGIVARTADGTITARTITGTATRVTVTNGDGVSGNPTIDLATVTNSNTGTFQKVNVDGYGRVTGTTAVVEADITGLVGNTFVKVDGTSTMGGDLNLNGFTLSNLGSLSLNSNKITDLGIPTAPTDAATKSYVDSVAQGLDVKQSVRVATLASTGNLTLSGPNTIDGVALSTGDRVLVKNQTNPIQNGIYVVSTTAAWTRADDMSAANEFAGAFTFVEEGTTLADTGWVCTVDQPVTVGTTPITWAQFSGAGTYLAAGGVQLDGNTFKLSDTAAGSGLTLDSNNALNIKTGNGLEVNNDTLELKDTLAGAGLLYDTGVLDINYGDGLTIETDVLKLASTVAGGGLLLTTGVLSVRTGNGITVNNDIVELDPDLAGNGLTLTNGVLAVGGTSNRITVGATSIDIASTYVGQTSITTLGTVTTGKWNADVIDVQYGGTGLSSIAQNRIPYASSANTYNTSANFTYNQATTTFAVGGVSVDGVNSTVGAAAITIESTGGNASVVLAPNGTGTVNVSTKRISNLADPTNDQDAVTKNYYHTAALDGGTF